MPVIKYSYSVAEAPYQAEKIGNGIYIGTTRDSLKHWAKRYPAHAEVQVYYNPADPKDAVLEPTSNSNIVGFMVGIAIDLLSIFLFGLWLYQLLIRR